MNKFKKIETLAWVILLTAFCMCVILAVGTPWSIRWLVMNTTRPLKVFIQPRAGVVARQEPGSSTSTLLSSETEITNKTTFRLSENAEAWLLFYHPEGYVPGTPTPPIVTVQLYGETDITIENAQSPRFSVSRLPNQITLAIRRGANTQIAVEDNDRPTVLHVQTPHGAAEMERGAYTVVVEDDQTEFAVSSGKARIPNPETGEKFILGELQRAEITAAGLTEIYTGERDILRNRNGDFELPLEGTWEVFSRTAFADQSSGTVRQVTLADNRHIVLLERMGQGFSEAGITQQIDQDIRGVQSLRVRARLRIDTQTLSVCGSLGTECPVMIRIKYTDRTGALREWLQGFYVKEGDNNQPVCQSCEWQAVHIKVAQPGVWHNYESPDLLPLMRAKGIEPVAIQRVDIYASGHAYGSAIDEIAILVTE
ncbi:MAG: hypothetical protein WHX52_20550 [Anaerolineae bacterium]